MEITKNILPEAFYTYEKLMFKDVELAFEEKSTIIGVVETISHEEKVLSVRLSDDIVATLPYEEATIYPFTYSNNNPDFPYPLQLSSLRGKTICAKVKSISSNNIILSRKDNMLEGYEAIKEKTTLPFYVTSARDCFVFGDVGYGIQAKLGRSDLCKSRIHSTSELCKKGDSFYVKVLNFDKLKRANVSYKELFPEYNPDDFTPGEIVTGTINSPVENTTDGLYVNIGPQICGIMDCKGNHFVFEYGDKVECVVKSASPKGLHLRFLKFAEN